MTGDEVLEFVESRGVVLESASGPVPSLAEEVAGEPVGGRWWGHPLADEIYAATRIARASDEILVCRLVEGKVTYVHRGVWPALVRLADRLPADRLAEVVETHTDAGRHRVDQAPFPDWVPEAIEKKARKLSEAEARRTFGPWIEAESSLPDEGSDR